MPHRLAAFLATLAIWTSVVVQPLSAAAAVPNDPTTWRCDADTLALHPDAVQLAPFLDGGKLGSPDPLGRYVPIIMVHGWVGKDTHVPQRDGAFSHLIDLISTPGESVTTDRSLIGQLQHLAGVAVFTFDYRDFAASWVDDAHLGPALGRVVDCLYRASGEKVIIVGHSMGGLVARYAATQPGLDGSSDRSGEISRTITFGTPETGSIAAMILNAAANAAAVRAPELALLRVILAYCGQLAGGSLKTGTACDALPPPARAFDSAAGVALRYGSKELAALKPWPAKVTVNALAGDATFLVPDGGWFGLSWGTTPIALGDLVVTAGSALTAATSTHKVTCSYQLSAVRAATDRIGLALKLAARPEVADLPLAAFSGGCFHTALMRYVELTNYATQRVQEDLASRLPVTADDLMHAPVPAACRHKAGTLANGRLPGIPSGQGEMELAWLGHDSATSTQLALGDLNGDDAGDAATLLHCNAGGVAWPELVALYTHGPKLLGFIDLSDITTGGHSAGENTAYTKIVYANGSVQASWITEQDDDPASRPSLAYSATLRWNGKKIAVTQVQATTERDTAARFVAAAHAKNSADLKRMSSSDVATEALSLARQYPAAFASAPTCAGVNADLPVLIFYLIDPGLGDHADDTDRICYMPTRDGGLEYVAFGMEMDGFRQWHVGWIRAVAAD